MALKRWRRTPCGDSPKQKAGISVIARLSRKPGDESRSEIGTMRRVGPELEFVTRLNICVFLRLPNSCPPPAAEPTSRAALRLRISHYYRRHAKQMRTVYFTAVLYLLSPHGIRTFTVFVCFCRFLVHGQVTIIFAVSVCLFVCLCRVFLSRLWSDFDQTIGRMLYVWV